MLFSEKRRSQVKVNVTGNVLVASFELSEPPTVWQFDLDKNHSFTLSLKRHDAGWDLGIASFGDEFLPIAYFENYDAAEAAIETVKKSIIGRLGHRKLSYKNPIIAAILAMLALFFGLYSYAVVTYKADINQISTGVTPNPAAVLNNNAPSDTKVGVPVPADELLKQ